MSFEEIDSDQLYGLTASEDCSQDWFVVANLKIPAERGFADYEGFSAGEPVAEMILQNVDAAFHGAVRLVGHGCSATVPSFRSSLGIERSVHFRVNSPFD